jgi:hypothetical protein
MKRLDESAEDELDPDGPSMMCVSRMAIKIDRETDLQAKKDSLKPPTMGPKTLPPTLENTTNATAYC